MTYSAAPCTRIYLTRHGLSEHNLNTGIFMGRAPESRLVDTGREQARQLGRFLASCAGLDHIICSSLPRTMETARIIADIVGLEEVSPEDALWELSKGDWEGAMANPPPPEVQREMEKQPYEFRYGGGESYREVESRAAPVFEKWVRANPGKSLLFVLHGDVIRALLHHTIRFPADKISDFAVDPCSLNELRAMDGRYHVLGLNDSCHLRSGH